MADAACTARALEGAVQGGMTGALWGSLVALRARLRTPAPRALPQVATLVGGHVVALAALLAIFNAGSCTSRQVRERLAGRPHADFSGAERTRKKTATRTQETITDSMVGGFLAGFIVSIPLHRVLHPTVGPAASRVPRIAWMSCLGYGAMMSGIGAAIHTSTQPPTATQPRQTGITHQPDQAPTLHSKVAASSSAALPATHIAQASFSDINSMMKISRPGFSILLFPSTSSPTAEVESQRAMFTRATLPYANRPDVYRLLWCGPGSPSPSTKFAEEDDPALAAYALTGLCLPPVVSTPTLVAFDSDYSAAFDVEAGARKRGTTQEAYVRSVLDGLATGAIKLGPSAKL